jgi:hypothetical protein
MFIFKTTKMSMPATIVIQIGMITEPALARLQRKLWSIDLLTMFGCPASDGIGTEQPPLKGSSPAPEFLPGIRRRLKLWSKNFSAKTRCSPSWPDRNVERQAKIRINAASQFAVE